MRQIMDVQIRTRRSEIAKSTSDLLAIGLFSDHKSLSPQIKDLDIRVSGAISRIVQTGDFKAGKGTSAIVYGNRDLAAKRILLIGLGDRKEFTLNTLRRAAGLAASKSVCLRASNLALAIHADLDAGLDLSEVGRVIAEGACFGAYRYDEYITKPEDGRLEKLRIEILHQHTASLKRLELGLSRGAVIGRAVNCARTMANRPANAVHPKELAALAKDIASTSIHLTCTVLNRRQMVKKGMGGILAVGSGSAHEPLLIVLKYTPPRAHRTRPTVGLVGKAITFDSGGISIKPATDMDQMKFDKSGGVAVLATLKAVAELGLEVPVLGIVPSAENLPSGTSYRPGDIITTYSGKTVEILNTDAEGRMILCDGLTYAVEQKCDIIIDIATLTGACMVALGKYKAGLMGNDDALIQQLQKAADRAGEPVWPMPCTDEYADEIKSKIADLKNTGGKWGGACTAAAFLRQFVAKARWAHLDIAGVDVFQSPMDSPVQGASGFGVRLLAAYLMNLESSRK